MMETWSNRIAWQRWVGAFCLAALAATIALTHTAARFAPYRYKVPSLPMAAQDGSARVGLDNGAMGPLQPPSALILRATAGERRQTSLTVLADNHVLCQVDIPASQSERVDCTITALSRQPTHEILVRANDGAPWTLDYLEVATHFGNVTEPNVVFITPKGIGWQRPGVFFTVLVTVVTFAGALLSVPRRRPWAARTFATLSGLALLLLLATLVTPLVSQFNLVLSQGTLCRWLVLARLSPLVAAGRQLFRASSRFTWPVAATRAVAVASLVLLGFWSVPRWQLPTIYDNNYSGFLKIQESFFDENPLVATLPGLKESLRVGEDGYDGEMMWALAFDPLATRFADRPAAYRDVVGITPGYRMGRIGFSLLTAIASGGDWFKFPRTMMWSIAGGLWLAAVALALLAQHAGKGAAFGFLILLVPGFWVSIQTGLPEPIAAAALLWGVLFLEIGLWLPGALCLGYSLLVRETGALAVLWIAFYCWRRRGYEMGIKVAAVALLPVVLWRAYLALMLWPAFGPAGVMFKSPSDLPLRGIVHTWQHVLAGDYWPHVWQLGFAARAFSVLLVLVALSSVLWFGRGALAIGTVAWAYALNALMLDFPAVWAHVWNTERTTFELFVVTAIVCATASLSRRQQQVATALAVLCAVHLTVSALDARLIRDTVVAMLIAS